jgi:DNA mismatch repair protein MutL
MEARTLEVHRQDVSRWARGASPGSPAASAGVSTTQQAHFEFPHPPVPPAGPGLGRHGEFRPFPETGRRSAPLTAERPRSLAAGGAAQGDADPLPDAPLVRSTPRPLGLQLHNRYLVTEDVEGMMVIDQHALHERILYEQLREKVLSGRLETQRLLVPEPVALTAPEAAAALGARQTLEQLGMQVEAFGGDTVLVSSYPAMLANFPPREILRQVVDLLLTGSKAPDRRDLLDELLHMISCKAAVKAGDRLSEEEVGALLEQRELYRDTHHCPHGRPTALVFTREELDKRFKRT